MYSELYLRLEPVGLERVAATVRAAGHDVRLLDLQISTHDDFRRQLADFKPQAVGFSLNYLANVPEVIDLAKETRRRITTGEHFEALEVARDLGLTVAVNIIADCNWDERQFEVVREWAMTVPEIVHLTVATPYPGNDHQRPVTYEMKPPRPVAAKPNPAEIFVHMPAKLQKPAAQRTATG